MSEALGRRSPPACSISMPGPWTRWPRTSEPGRARCRSSWDTARSGIATGAGHAAGPDARAQPRRLPAGEPYGERRLTNFLHLGELLQQASGELDGEYARCAGSGGGEPAQRPGRGADTSPGVRAQAGADRHHPQIQGAGVPAGLPAVHLQPPRRRHPLFHETGRRAIVPCSIHRRRRVPGRGRQGAPRRRLAPALRGPDPGVYATWLGLAPVRSGAGKSEKTDLHRTAIGYLLQRGRKGTPGHWRPPSPTWPRPLPGWLSVSPRSPARPRCPPKRRSRGAHRACVPGAA